MSEDKGLGTVGWFDLTVKDCPEIRDFYQAVVGWESTAEEMDGYADYSMIPPGGDDPVAGICHARGLNANMPAQWLIYIRVADVHVSLAHGVELGGKLLVEPRDFGSYGSICVIQDPAGAVVALQSMPASSKF